MSRKSKYDQLVDSITSRLREMGPEHASSIEEAFRNDQTLANTGLASPTTIEDYDYCPDCGHVRYLGNCYVCP